MKKIIAFILAMVMTAMLCLALTSCSDEDEDEEKQTVKITSLNASGEEFENEVPYQPKRVAILDYAVLDMMDNFGVGDRVVSSARTTIDYLSEYTKKMDAGTIVDLGNLQTYDMEKLQQSEPDIIFIGGRQSKNYDELQKIAPVVYLSCTAGQVVSDTLKNAKTVAAIFGIDESKITELTAGFNARIDALKAVAAPAGESAKTAMVLIYTSDKSIGALGSGGRCSIICDELGFVNLYESNADATHGESFSFETIAKLNPDYLFVLNRGFITSSGETSNASVVEVMTNSLTAGTTALQNGHLIVMDHPDTWYTAEGGISALDTMLADLESVLLP